MNLDTHPLNKLYLDAERTQLKIADLMEQFAALCHEVDPGPPPDATPEYEANKHPLELRMRTSVGTALLSCAKTLEVQMEMLDKLKTVCASHNPLLTQVPARFM